MYTMYFIPPNTANTVHTTTYATTAAHIVSQLVDVHCTQLAGWFLLSVRDVTMQRRWVTLIQIGILDFWFLFNFIKPDNEKIIQL